MIKNTKTHRHVGLFLATFLTLAGCSSAPDELTKAPLGPEDNYAQAKALIASGNFTRATEILSALDSQFPFGPLSHQVQLDLIYTYYKIEDSDQALARIDRFLKLNPDHADIDYVYYMRGITNMDSDSNVIQELAGVDRSDRDTLKYRQAFDDFKTLLKRYPDSKYVTDAKKRMEYIRDRLARYEISVAQYYMKRDAYVAAANRGKYVVEYFSSSPYVQQGLEVMVECYRKLGMDELRDNAILTLKLNFPDSVYID